MTQTQTLLNPRIPTYGQFGPGIHTARRSMNKLSFVRDMHTLIKIFPPFFQFKKELKSKPS